MPTSPEHSCGHLRGPPGHGPPLLISTSSQEPACAHAAVGFVERAQCLALGGPRWALEFGSLSVPRQGQATTQCPLSPRPRWEPAQFSSSQASHVFTKSPCGDHGLRGWGGHSGRVIIWCRSGGRTQDPPGTPVLTHPTPRPVGPCPGSSPLKLDRLRWGEEAQGSVVSRDWGP